MHIFQYEHISVMSKAMIDMVFIVYNQWQGEEKSLRLSFALDYLWNLRL